MSGLSKEAVLAAIARQAQEQQAQPSEPQGLIGQVMNFVRRAPNNRSTAGQLANRDAYLQYVQQAQMANQQPLPFEAWAQQQQ